MRSEPSAVDVACVTRETTGLFFRNLVIVINCKATLGSKPALKTTFYKSCLFPSMPFMCIRKGYRANMIGRGLMGLETYFMKRIGGLCIACLLDCSKYHGPVTAL